jgi:hypothetical protein
VGIALKPSDEDRGRIGRWGSRGAAIVLALVAGGILAAQVYQRSAIPSEQDWSRAADLVRKSAGEGAAFRVEPAWDARPRVFLESMTYIPATEATWFDTQGFSPIWLLAEAGREPEGVAHFPADWRVKREERFGRVTALELVPPAEDSTLWDVFSSLDAAEVARRYKDRTEPCERWVPGAFPRWDCASPDSFLYVGESMQVVTNDFHRCLWAMPIDRGGTVEIGFDDVPLGAAMHGYYGQPIDAVRSRRGTPVHFSVWIDGAKVHTKTFALDEEGFQPFTIDTRKGDRSRGEVVFKVQADVQLDRFFCFAARTRSSMP